MALDPAYVAFVKQEEGFAPVATWDYEQWSNGYGTRARYPRERITEAEADVRLEAELTKAQDEVERFDPNLPQGPLNALTDLTYNAGSAWMHAGLGQAVKAQNWSMAKAHYLLYNKAGGRTNAGLEARRAKAAEWFPVKK